MAALAIHQNALVLDWSLAPKVSGSETIELKPGSDYQRVLSPCTGCDWSLRTRQGLREFDLN